MSWIFISFFVYYVEKKYNKKRNPALSLLHCSRIVVKKKVILKSKLSTLKKSDHALQFVWTDTLFTKLWFNGQKE